MTIHTQTLTNPGAESGTTTGWTVRSGVSLTANSSFHHSGSWSFRNSNSAADDSRWDQEITVDGGLFASIDAGTAACRATTWILGGFSDLGHLYLEFYDSGHALLDSADGSDLDPSSWTQQILTERIPANTRYIRIGGDCHKTIGTVFNTNFDDFTLEISDDASTDYMGYFDPKAHQLGAYALAIFPTAQIRASQFPIAALAASEGSSGLYKVFSHQLGAYALCRPNADRRELRAWTFKQDDHEFYGIQLGSVGTLVWDKLTGQWCQWRSPGYVFWRAEDVVDWEGYNIAGDTESGKLWKIDPTGRLDEGVTPITSIVVGYLNKRLRMSTPCYAAELAVSEGNPPEGFDDGSVGITLRTSSDEGESFVNHGEIIGGGIDEDVTVRWYGLGLMEEPGMIFEFTDTGYARRIDGLTIQIKE